MENRKLETYKELEKACHGTLWMALEESEKQLGDAIDLLSMCRRYPLKERTEGGTFEKFEQIIMDMLVDISSQIYDVAQIMKNAEGE